MEGFKGLVRSLCVCVWPPSGNCTVDSNWTIPSLYDHAIHFALEARVQLFIIELPLFQNNVFKFNFISFFLFVLFNIHSWSRMAKRATSANTTSRCLYSCTFRTLSCLHASSTRLMSIDGLHVKESTLRPQCRPSATTERPRKSSKLHNTLEKKNQWHYDKESTKIFLAQRWRKVKKKRD